MWKRWRQRAAEADGQAGDGAEEDVGWAGLALGEVALLHHASERGRVLLRGTAEHSRAHGLEVQLRIAEGQLTWLRLLSGEWSGAVGAAAWASPVNSRTTTCMPISSSPMPM